MTVAILCEGEAEKAIIELLIDKNLLIFSSEEMIHGKPFRSRNAKIFSQKELNHQFENGIDIYRILDSKNEKFKIKFPYDKQVNAIYNVLTCPEIELLIIINENKYDNFKKKNLKPSDYIKNMSKFKGEKIKSSSFVKSYWLYHGIDKLVNSIFICSQKMNLSKRTKHKKENYDVVDISLYDLINHLK